jgi:hypothetical protein
MRTIFYLFLVTLLFSCTIEKRLYRPGYHVESHLFSKNDSERNDSYKPKKLKRQHDPELQLETKELVNELEVVPSLAVVANPCDTIVLKSGEKVVAKIETITEYVVSYKRCDNPDGPLYEEPIRKIDFVTFSNGKQENFSSNSSASNNSVSSSSSRSSGSNYASSNGNKELEPMGVLSLVSLILVLVPAVGFVFWVASPILAILSLIRFKRESERWRGRAFPVIALVLWIITVLWILLAIIFIASLFGA